MSSQSSFMGEPSSQDGQFARKGLMLVFVGPTGSGKSTVCKRLSSEYAGTASVSVSATSRLPREGEVEGQSYYFLSRSEFEKRAAHGDFYEWEEVHGNLYGTLGATVQTALEQGTDLLFDIDIKGASKIKMKAPAQTVVVFLAPPSPHVLLERVKARSTISAEELQVRLRTAAQEYDIFLRSIEVEPAASLEPCAARDGVRGGRVIDYFLLNDNLHETVRAARCILEAERLRVQRWNLESLRAICRVEYDEKN